MYAIGDFVVHSGHGVCTIKDKKFNEQFNKYFYYLETISNKMTISLPEEKANIFLRPIVSEKVCKVLMNNVDDIPVVYSKDNKERKNQFQVLVSSNEFKDTLTLLKCLYALMDEKKKEKKTLGSFDTQFLQQAQRKFFDEIIIALKITKDQAETFITQKLKSPISL